MKIHLRHLGLIPVLAFCILAEGCVLRDWYHDLRYGDMPPPTTPIAPPAEPMPDRYSERDAVALMTDSLIFVLSNLSAKGKPEMTLVLRDRKPDPKAERLYRELLRSRVITVRKDMQSIDPKSFLLFSGSDANGNWNVTLERADRSAAVFNKTIKLKELAEVSGK